MLILLIAFLIPRSPIPRDTVSQIEINHYYGNNDEEVFTQLIFWERRGPLRVVLDWRIIKRPERLPRRDPKTGWYILRWMDGDVYREVRARSRIETWTDHDPEMLNRIVWPQELRRKLRSK